MKFLYVIIAAICPMAASAQVVKCTDASGKVTYSSTPCAADAAVASVNLTGANQADADKPQASAAAREVKPEPQPVAESVDKTPRTQRSYRTKDQFGTSVRSDKCYWTKDQFGTSVKSGGCK